MSRYILIPFIGILLGVVLPLTPIALKAVHAWEKQNNYPYGRMCDPNIFNGWQSTCKPEYKLVKYAPQVR